MEGRGRETWCTEGHTRQIALAGGRTEPSPEPEAGWGGWGRGHAIRRLEPGQLVLGCLDLQYVQYVLIFRCNF